MVGRERRAAVANQTECRAQRAANFLAVSRKESNPVASSCGERHFIGAPGRVCDTFRGTRRATRAKRRLYKVFVLVFARAATRARVCACASA